MEARPGDFWERIDDLKDGRDSSKAAALMAELLAAPWDSLSGRDTIEYFTEVLRLEETVPGTLGSASEAVYQRIASDRERGYRQLPGQGRRRVQPGRNLAGFVANSTGWRPLPRPRYTERRCSWPVGSPRRRRWCGGGYASTISRQLIKAAHQGDSDVAAGLMVGIAYRLICYLSQTDTDRVLIDTVYAFYHPGVDAAQWFSAEGTAGGT